MTSKRFITYLACLFTVISFQGPIQAQVAPQKRVNEKLKVHLEAIYMQWRSSMIKKNYNSWTRYTSMRQRISVQNRIFSEQRPFPASIFQVPAFPPTIENLTALRVQNVGVTATAVYFGKVDFGVGGKPTENLLLLHFVYEKTGWKYDSAEFFKLDVRKDVRKKIKAGDFSHVDHKDFSPSGKAPARPVVVPRAKYIAKAYVFCPGREVKLKVNEVSEHRFQNTKASEIVIGGATDQLNTLSFTTKALEGSTGKEAISIRIYLMSTVKGVKPIKVFQYQVKEGGVVKPFSTGEFRITEAQKRKLLGK